MAKAKTPFPFETTQQTGTAMLEHLRPFYNTILTPFARAAAALRLHPNVFTFAGLFFFSFSGWFIWQTRPYIALCCMIIGALMDGLDGVLARYRHIESRFGGILDSTIDRITEIAWFTGFCGYFLSELPSAQAKTGILLVLLGITGALMVSYVKARSEAAGVQCSAGILQRPERIIIMGVILLVPLRVQLWLFAVLALGTYYTAVRRLIAAARNEKIDSPHAPADSSKKG